MSCKICFEDISADGFVKLECEHSVCRNCLSRIIEVNIRGYSTYNIRCPEVKCMKPISNELTKKVLKERKAEKLLKKFEKIEIDQLLVQDPSLQLCVNDDCKHLIKTQPSDKHSFIICLVCKSSFCIDCRQTDHKDRQCPVRHAQGIEHLRESRQVLPCPKCKVNIQKVDGCNEMKCPLCRDQFCWVCGKRKGEWHYSYLNIFGCPGMQLQTKKAWLTKLKSFVLLSLILCLVSLGVFFVHMLLTRFFWILSFVFADFLLTYVERRYLIRIPKATTILTHFSMLIFFDDLLQLAKGHRQICIGTLAVALIDWAYFSWTKYTMKNRRRHF